MAGDKGGSLIQIISFDWKSATTAVSLDILRVSVRGQMVIPSVVLEELFELVSEDNLAHSEGDR